MMERVLRNAIESEPNRGRPNHAALRTYDEFAPGILANAASRCTESSPLRSATLTCARRCAPSSVQRICRFFAMRWLTTWLTAHSAMLLDSIERPWALAPRGLVETSICAH